VGTSAWRMEEGEKGAAQGQQLNHAVGMALGGAVEGGNSCSWWGQAGEQGRVGRCGRRGVTGHARLTGRTRVRRDPVSAAGYGREWRGERREVGRWRGINTRAQAAQRRAAWFKLGLNQNQNSNETKLISNSFKFDCFKQDLLRLQKFETKYGWKVFEIRNNFNYRDFLRFKMDFELKFREASVG
jgi:hypothetical protein